MNDSSFPSSPNRLSAAPTRFSSTSTPTPTPPSTATVARFSPDRLSSPRLPHHKLLAYTVSLEFLAAVRAAGVRDATLRDHALRSAKSACLNSAEGAGRSSRPDKARAFTIARAEACEAAAAVEIAASSGDASSAASAQVNRLADRLVALLTGLIR